MVYLYDNAFEQLLNFLFSEVYCWHFGIYNTITNWNYEWFVSTWVIKAISPLTTHISDYFLPGSPVTLTSRTAKTWHPISILPRISRKQKYIWPRKMISNCSKWGISFIRLVLRAEIRWSSAERMEMTSDHSRSLSETRAVFSSVNIQEEIL